MVSETGEIAGTKGKGEAMNEAKPTPVWIVRYCLSDGIIAGWLIDGDLQWHDRQGVKHCVNADGSHRHGRDYFTDRLEAEAKAELMRKRKIASLRKQIARLEELDFQEAS